MDVFGVHINFLWFIQVLALIFILKIHFLFIFLDFLILWTGRIKSENTRGLDVINPKTQTTVTWVADLLYKNRGATILIREGVSCNHGRRISRRRRELDPIRDEQVCNEIPRISNQRCRF
jgi:hypothetical protein